MICILVKKMFDVACCKAQGVPNNCLGICETQDSVQTFRTTEEDLPNNCELYKEKVNDKCVVGMALNPGNLYSQLEYINIYTSF